MGRLENKVAIVTGGASGFGESMVDLFSNEGATVIAVEITDEKLKKVNAKENVHGLKSKVDSDEEWEALAKEVKKRYGKIDILVNNNRIHHKVRLPSLN